MDGRPLDTGEYREWAEQNLSHDYGDQTRRWYENAAQNFASAVEKTGFWAGLPHALDAARTAYAAATGSDLFPTVDTPTIAWSVKPYDSVVDKLFRKNVVWNNRWPKEPRDGWFEPGECLTQLDDSIRARLVCTYIDGPRYLVAELEKLADANGVGFSHDSRELDAGYYAYHLYFEFSIDSFDRHFADQNRMATAELQIVTRLQDVMGALTHQFYEQTRLELKPDKKSWKWEHRSPRFRSAFLGHTLHLLEGIILDVRDGIAVASDGQPPPQEENSESGGEAAAKGNSSRIGGAENSGEWRGI